MAAATATTRCLATGSFSRHTPSTSTQNGWTWNSTVAMPVDVRSMAAKKNVHPSTISTPAASTQGHEERCRRTLAISRRNKNHTVRPSRPNAQRNQVAVNGCACASWTKTPIVPRTREPAAKSNMPDAP